MPNFSSLRSASYSFVLLAAWWALGSAAAIAATPAVASRTAQPALKWQIRETENFRILSYGTAAVDKRLAAACESARQTLVDCWLPDQSHSWQPKCDIVLHTTDAAYIREVGAGGKATLASSLVDHREGRITLRRIDVRSGKGDWVAESLPHELTHVVLADRFAGRQLPRWMDEGLAILADPAEKQSGHRRDLDTARGDRGAFRVVELLQLADYPEAHRWGAFYGQSASLVGYLVERDSPAAFIRFADTALTKGYDLALREVYDLQGVADLEKAWLAHDRMAAGHHPEIRTVATRRK